LASWRQLQETKPEPEAEPLLRPAPKSVVFVDPASQHLLALAKRVAQAEVTALLVGPTGSGKEVLARVLHEYSPRAKGPFVAMNCAAMPDHLIEDMLFGHEKGAFTGAHKDHKGLFEQAQGGTLFLDEIGEMPMHLQSKLLRVLQEKQLTRLGGQQVLHLNVRIIAATNKDLKGAISSKEFREDLYYRIATFRMRLLPLNQRRGDIIPLALQFLSQQAKGHKWQIDEEAQSLLLEYAWPGNVRELENVMRRAMVLCPHQTIGTAHLMFDDWVTDNPVGSNGADSVSPLSEVATTSSAATTVAEAPPSPSVSDLYSATRISEHQVIMATLAETTNREEAAKRLGISPRTLRYKLAQFKAHGLSMAA
jgi:two-component system response regulator FlrC